MLQFINLPQGIAEKKRLTGNKLKKHRHDVEKALRYLEDMQGRQFVGTESRLKLLLEMINNLVEASFRSLYPINLKMRA